MSIIDKIAYQFPPRLSNSPDMPEIVKQRLRQNHFVLVALFQNSQEMKFTLSIAYNTTPNKLLEQILHKKSLATGSKTHNDRLSDYIIKVCGHDEYIFGDYPLTQFLYIRDTISDNL